MDWIRRGDYDDTLNTARNTTNNRLLLAILFSFLTVVGSGSVTVGDLPVAPNSAVSRWLFSEGNAIAKVSDESLAFANRLRNAPGRTPAASSVIVDARTGKIYHGVARRGKSILDNIHPTLKDRMPDPSLEAWHPANCAEFNALNRALLDGGSLDDLFIHTMRPGGKHGPIPLPRCGNCRMTTDGAWWITP